MYSSIVYRKAPIWGQEALIAARAWARMQLREGSREGSRFRRLMAELESAQWLDPVALAQAGRHQLAELLRHAVTQCPFYRRFAPEVGRLEPERALGEFPLIDKPAVRQAGRALLARDARHPLFEGSTSGTTGTPLTLTQDLHAINRENAFLWRQLRWAGLREGGRRAWIRGDLIAPAAQKTPPFWRHNRTERMLMMSSYHLAEPNAGAYIEALAGFSPQVIQAYPSSIGFLAAWLEAAGRDYPGSGLNGIVTSSETLDPETRALIERRFGCRVFDWYGQFERVAAIGTCEYGRYHLIADYAHVEFLPAGDNRVEIVGTGLGNRAMPLIRYRTGDFVELADPAGQCRCGRHFPLVRRIHGRSDAVLKLPNGRQIGRLDHLFKGVDGLLEAQIRQDAVDRIDILVVAGPAYGQQTERRLLANARERLGDGIGVVIWPVQSIPRTANGKFRGVVCNV